MSMSWKAMWGGGLAGFIGWLVSLNWLGLIGTAIAIAGGAVNIYATMQRHYREKDKDKRDKLEHEARMATMKDRAPHRRGDIHSGAERLTDE